MKWFVAFLTKYGFKAFGIYRIIVGTIIIVLLLTGHSLAMVDKSHQGANSHKNGKNDNSVADPDCVGDPFFRKVIIIVHLKV